MERTTNRGRPKGSRGGRGKGKRGRKPRVVVSDTEESNEKNPQEPEATSVEPQTEKPTEMPAPEVAEDTPMEVKETVDITQSNLEAPSFTMMQRNVPQVMLRLNWDHKVNLIGEKVLNPMIYCCDQCEKPILIYGRMIQCKHVFCLTCARTEAVLKICPRCKEKVVRVEQTGLGTVFMCTHGGTMHGRTGCRRTYLSQRDLQAHINHRHMPISAPPQDIKPTEKSSLSATSQIGGPQQQQNSHLRKDSMVQPQNAMPHPLKQHGLNQPFNPSVFPPRMNDNQQSSMGMMNSHSATNKLSHHSQDMHGFYNQQMNYGGHSFNNNGAGSSSGMSNNFYSNNMGHYSQQAPPQQQQPQQNWNQQQYFR